MANDEYRWSETRDEGIEAFEGETPGAQLETDIREHFINDPEKVRRAINRVASMTGDIRSRWAVLRADLNRQATNDVVATGGASKQRLIDNAKRWIHNAGIHYDLQCHVEAELFGDDHGSGILRDITLTDQQKAELTDYWRQQRPRGIQAEQRHEQYMADLKAATERAAAALAAKKAKAQEGDTCQTSTNRTSSTNSRKQSENTTDGSGSSTRQQQAESSSHLKTPASSASPSSNSQPDPVAATTGSDIQW